MNQRGILLDDAHEYLDELIADGRFTPDRHRLPGTSLGPLGAEVEVEPGIEVEVLGTTYEILDFLAQQQSAEAPPPAADQAPLPRCRHSVDFRDVVWNGVSYKFGRLQAISVKVMWQAWENGTPELGQRTILAEAGSDSTKLVDVFRNHPAWGVMIVTGSTPGTYRLSEPEAQ
jgi:hypothetical protein